MAGEAYKRAIGDVLEFLALRSTILPDFPATPTTLRLGCGQINPKDEAGIKGIPMLEGSALLRAVLGDQLPALFPDETPGVSTNVRDVLMSDDVCLAIARYFGWQPPSPGIGKQQLLWLMVHYCDIATDEELGKVALDRWAQEFYRPLAIIARSALYPTWSGEVVQTKNYIANLGNGDYPGRAKVEMDTFLATVGAYGQILDENWLDRFPIARNILEESAPGAASRKINKLPRRR